MSLEMYGKGSDKGWERSQLETDPSKIGTVVSYVVHFASKN
jgi:hypothetical protein